MSVLLLCSAKGSPGVTASTLALALSWPRPAVVVCADPAGDDLRAGVLQASVPASTGLLGLALSARKGAADLAAHALAIEGGGGAVWLVPGLADPAQADAIAVLWPQVLLVLAGCGRDVLIDAGRLPAGGLPPALHAAADVVALVLRPALPAVDRARPALSRLSEMAWASMSVSRVGLLCIGEAPYPPGDCATALGTPLLGVLPHDSHTAARLADGEVPWRRPLLRSARGLARRLLDLASSQDSAHGHQVEVGTP